ncbi:ATP-binding protein [Paraglaciecola sp. 2405UD69-4]|uniref:ATP-binding protein n=1 Tax=Paraglaciecola sp. 2405UD69-4 TaxID=3391836 RepID=UPI0039C8C566
MKTHLQKGTKLIWTPLQKKVFLLVASLFILVFALTLLSIYQAAYNQAEREFIARLKVGENVFKNEVTIAKQHLDSSVETIAKDWALRSAIGQGEDPQSIRSVLFNHGKRIEADIALVLDREFKLIAQYGNEDVIVDRSFAQNFDKQQQSMPWIAMVGEQPFMMSADPIKAPATIGWLLMGKRLNHEFLSRTKSLISLDINILVTQHQASSILLSSLENSPEIQNELAQVAANFVAQKSESSMYVMEADDVVVLPFSIFKDQERHFVVVLQDSISAWLQTRNAFMLELLPFFIVGILLALLGSFFIARSITRPVSRLLEVAQLVAAGNYTEKINISEKSELGELAKEFSNMQSAVMERERKIKDQAEEIRQTHLIKYQVELAQKEQNLAASATEAKSLFLANVSHEIRTPLNSVVGYSAILNDPSASAEEKNKAVQAVHNGGQYLLNIVNDVLDLSKIEAGKIQLNKTETSLVNMLDEVASHIEGFALEKHLKFDLKLNFPLPEKFITDGTRLKQILLNICNNAIKFTQEGQVDVQIHLDSYRRRLIFVVSDTGPGMSDEQQLRLFTAFSQGNQAINRKYGGTGLGLYISKQLIELLGGHIKVTSQEGHGSQFAVYLPWIESDDKSMLMSDEQVEVLRHAEVKNELTIPKLSGCVLAVDDNQDNRDLVSYLLSKTGLELVLAEDGEQALKFAQEQDFDLILMDMQMPVLDGLQTTTLLKKRGVKSPVIMLTANVDSGSKQQVFNAGAVEHFAKPIDTRKFYDLLDKYLGSKQPVEQAKEPAATLTEFEKLVDKYRMSFKQKSADINQAVAAQDWNAVKALMHKIKGSAGSYGFQKISDFAVLIEERIEQNELNEAQQYILEMGSYMEDLYNN